MDTPMTGKISEFVAHIRSAMWNIGYPFSPTAPRPNLNTEQNRTDTDREDGHYANRQFLGQILTWLVEEIRKDRKG